MEAARQDLHGGYATVAFRRTLVVAIAAIEATSFYVAFSVAVLVPYEEWLTSRRALLLYYFLRYLPYSHVANKQRASNQLLLVRGKSRYT